MVNTKIKDIKGLKDKAKLDKKAEQEFKKKIFDKVLKENKESIDWLSKH